MLRHTFILGFFLICLHVSGQQSRNVMKVLSSIKSIPHWYKKDYTPDSKGKNFKNVDSTYRVIAGMDSFAIIRLIPILSDTSDTSIPNTCDGGNLTFGQLAFLLINDIELIPLGLVTKTQWDAMGDCIEVLPYGFLTYLRTNGKRFEKQYREYFNSKQRQQYLKGTLKSPTHF
jgi:hypothetical protein